MRLFRVLFTAATAAALLGACSQAPAAQPDAATSGTPAATTAAETASTADATGAYPGPDAAGAAYPGPDAAGAAYPGPTPQPFPTVSMDPIVVPEPSSAQVGNATGTLLRLSDDGTRTPIQEARLYLGGIIQSTDGQQELVEMDRTTSPYAVTNGLGQFVFVDVPPGRYGLMYDGVEGTLLLRDPVDGSDFVIEITGGQVTDLGELAHKLPAT